eukprot:m.1072912 g.1072912  ORF g.1072912 m.1072912 type:complete len:54 (+) comp24231_c0_seq128:6991-7152(+)
MFQVNAKSQFLHAPSKPPGKYVRQRRRLKECCIKNPLDPTLLMHSGDNRMTYG